MSLAVTGATGHLGGLIVTALLDRGVEAQQIVALVRNPIAAAGLADRGVQVRRADYDDPRTVTAALEGVERLAFVSGSEAGRRVDQHRAVVEAALAHGVAQVAYTSIPQADTTPLLLAAEHKVTEEMIRTAGLPYTFLRNSWYLENYTGQLASYLEAGEIVGAAGAGRVSAAARQDYAAAAAAVITGDGHLDRTYELGGDEAFTMAELAQVVSDETGRQISYRDIALDEHTRALMDAGLPEPAAAVFADTDAGVARGDLLVESGDLARLIGRPTTTLREAVRTAVADLPGT